MVIRSNLRYIGLLACPNVTRIRTCSGKVLHCSLEEDDVTNSEGLGHADNNNLWLLENLDNLADLIGGLLRQLQLVQLSGAFIARKLKDVLRPKHPANQPRNK